jgi:hypothetical protein
MQEFYGRWTCISHPVVFNHRKIRIDREYRKRAEEKENEKKYVEEKRKKTPKATQKVFLSLPEA